MLKQATKGMNVEVDSFNTLLVDYVNKKDANVIIRGLRAVSDFEFELEMALMNRKLNPNLDTVFVMTDDNKAKVKKSSVSGKDEKCAKEGADSCPVDIIKVR